MFGERIRALRKVKGISMTELADAVGVARSTFAGYESEYRQPPLEVLRQIAIELETSVDYLLGLTDNPSPKDPEMNMKIILNNKELHWDGVPLNEEELRPIRDLLQIVVRDRLPKKTCADEVERNESTSN